MLGIDFIQILVFFGAVLLIVPLLGNYLAKIFQGKRTFLHPGLEWLEKLTYRLGGVNPDEEMSWRNYAKALLIFNFLGFLALFAIQLIQKYLPLNPQHFDNVAWPMAFNTALSFVTNTNWQAYSGESSLSYGTQMWGLTTQNFLSAATGNAVLLALIRGVTRKSSLSIGNFWSDMVRILVYVLLPLSVILALVLGSQGVIQTLSPYVEVHTLEEDTQIIALGPVASQVAIKQLGTNGGGFFNANSAHPFENPNPLTNFLEFLALVAIPAATVYAYGIVIGSKKHAYFLLLVMIFIWLGGLVLSIYSENLINPVMDASPVLEGKETRFGIVDSVLWSTMTTATSNGAINTMHESLSPLAGGVTLFNMMLGELVFGGVGVGLCSMLMFVLTTVFLCGLMVGRTPEYLGKKIEKRDIQWVMLAILGPSALILLGAGLACVLPEGLAGVSEKGPQGLTEILYAFASAAANNGSGFEGLDATTNFYTLGLGVVMLLGRLFIIIPSLAIAGNLAAKKITPSSIGTFSTNTVLFATLLFSVIIIVCALTFFPALSLGPIVEHILMLRGWAFESISHG